MTRFGYVMTTYLMTLCHRHLLALPPHTTPVMECERQHACRALQPASG